MLNREREWRGAGVLLEDHIRNQSCRIVKIVRAYVNYRSAEGKNVQQVDQLKAMPDTRDHELGMHCPVTPTCPSHLSSHKFYSILTLQCSRPSPTAYEDRIKKVRRR